MKTNETTSNLTDHPIDIKFKLCGLWITLVALYIYCDIFSFYRPGHIEHMMEGFMGPFPVNQISLLLGSLLMVFPSIMIAASLFLKARINRWVNIIVGAMYILVNIGNIAGDTWAYYWAYGSIEILITIVIVVLSVKWPSNKTNA